MNVTCALPKNSIVIFIREFIQERSLTNVVNVTNALPAKAVLKFIREFMQKKNLKNIMNMTNALAKNSHLSENAYSRHLHK